VNAERLERAGVDKVPDVSVVAPPTGAAARP
jgi:hypothetical protein